MRVIAIVNEKGGTAKSTTTVSLAAALGELGKRVLLVDLDGQAASSRWLGVEEDNALADAILRGGGLEPVTEVIPGVDLAPASGKLDSVAHDLRPTQGGQLRKVLMEVRDRYEYVLIDCPPSLGNRLIGNALLAATHAIAPVETSVLALDGLRILLTMLEDIRDGFDHQIDLIGVLACRFDERVRLSRLVLAELQRALGEKVFKTVIRENKQLQECPASGTSILQYAPRSSASEDYRALARELVDGQAQELELHVDGDLATDQELTNGDHLTVMSFRRKMSEAFGHGEPTDEATGQDLDAPAPDWTAPVDVPDAAEKPAAMDDLAQLQMAAAATRRRAPHSISNEPARKDPPWDLPSAQEGKERKSAGKKIIAGALIALLVGFGITAKYLMDTTAKSSANVGPTARPVLPTAPIDPDPAPPAEPAAKPTTPAEMTGPAEPTVPEPTHTAPDAGKGEGTSPEPAAKTPGEDEPADPAEPGELDPDMGKAEPTTPEPTAPKVEPTTRPATAEPASEPTTRPASARPMAEPTTRPATKATPGAQNAATGDTAPAKPNTQSGEPGASAGGHAMPPSGFVLSCVLKSGKGRFAIINSEIVEVGQKVKDATVVRIDPESVEMETGGKRFLLYIGGAGPKGAKTPTP